MILFKDDSLYDLLRGISKGRRVEKLYLQLILRDYDKEIIKHKSVQLSKKAREVYGITKIKKGVAKPKPKSELDGDTLWLEHIIPVRERIEDLIEIFSLKGGMSRKQLDEYISNTFYAVYKLKKEREEEYQAESLLLEDFRESDKIVNFKNKLWQEN